MPPDNDTIDFTLTGTWLEKQASRNKGGDPPHDGGSGGEVLFRVAAVEGRMAKLEDKLDGLIKDVGGMKERLASIDGRLTNLPSTFQVLTWFISVAMGLVALVFAIARSMGTH